MNGPADAISRAESILRAACGDRLRTKFPLAPLTTFRVGGPAEICAPHTVDELRLTLEWCAETSTPWRALGRGSNLLVSDDGVDGIVIQTRALDRLEHKGATGTFRFSATVHELVDPADAVIGIVEDGKWIRYGSRTKK